MKIRKGDEVIVTKGKDSGKKGRVMRAFNLVGESSVD